MTALEREKLGEWLSAYVDGELNAEQNALIERLIEEDEEVRLRLEEMRSVSRMVFDLPRHAAPPSILQDVRRQTERDALLGDAEEDRVLVPGQSRFGMRMLATAAMVTLMVTGALWMYGVLPGRSPGPGTALVSNVPKSNDAPSEGVAADSLEEALSKKGSAAEAIPGTRLADSRSGNRADLATLEQKISRLADTEELANHSFANEANTLTLTFATDRDRDQSLAALTDSLRVASVRELANDGSSSDVLRGGVFIEGREGVNFVGMQDRQVLVRVPKNQIESLVRGELGAQAEVDVRLQVGPIDVRGRDQVHLLTNAISQGDLGGAKGHSLDEFSDDEPAPTGFGEDAKTLGDLFASLTKPDDPPSPDVALETTTDAARAAGGGTAAAGVNGVFPPDATRTADSPDEGTDDEDSPIAKPQRRARGGRREARANRDADASSGRSPHRSANSDTFGEKEEAASNKMAKPAVPEEKVEPATDSAERKPVILPGLPDRPSLAARRLAEARRHMAGGEAAAPIEANDSNNQSSEAFVTLVIQLVSREPVRPNSHPASPKPATAKVKPIHKPAKRVKAGNEKPSQ